MTATPVAATPRPPLPRVRVFTLGGTIASQADDTGVAQVTLDGRDLLATCPPLRDVADLVVTSHRGLPSVDLDFRAMLELAEEINSRLESSVGVVVAQGTDTLEETAYLLDLLVPGDEALVVTGAMRAQNHPGADGAANLLAATRVAASPDARGLGAVVVMNDQIHAARYVRKWHSTLPTAFVSPHVGPLGYVVEDRVRIPLRPRGRLHIDVPGGARIARVAQISVHLGSDSALLASVPDLGYDGLVVAGTGGGHVPSWLMPDLRRVADRIPVVMASRTGAGEGLTSTYGYPGSEVDWQRDGVTSSLGLSPSQAVVLLTLLLTVGMDADDLQSAFEMATCPRGHVRLGRGPST